MVILFLQIKIKLQSMYWTDSLQNKSKNYSTIASSETFNSSIESSSFHLPSIKNPSQEKSPQKDFQDKVNKILMINKRHQYDQVCVCQDCIYIKQLYRNPKLKLDLSKNSSYRQQYRKNMPIFKTINKSLDLSASKINMQGSAVKSKYVQINSNYNRNFLNRSLEKIQKPRPHDLLRFVGPTVNTSSYLNQFPNLKGPYQYVEPLKQDSLIKKRFESKSLYSQSYIHKDIKKTQTGKIPDCLKLGKQSLVKESTNQSNFFIPNPESYQSIKKQDQKRVQQLNDRHQYETTTRNQFQKHEKHTCRNKRMQLQNFNRTRNLSSQLATIN